MEFLQKEEELLTHILAGVEGQGSPKALERQKELRERLRLIRAAGDRMAGDLEAKDNQNGRRGEGQYDEVR